MSVSYFSAISWWE